jgi:hypothetical protein
MKEQFPDLSNDQVIKFGIHDIQPEYVARIKEQLPGIEPQEIVRFGIHQLEPEFVHQLQEEMSNKGYDGLSTQDLVRMAIHDFDPDFVDEMRSVGFEDLTMRELLRLWSYNVDDAYVREVQAEKPDVTPREIIRMRRRERRDYAVAWEEWVGDLTGKGYMGYKRINMGDVADLMSIGVDPDEVEQAQEDDKVSSLRDLFLKLRPGRSKPATEAATDEDDDLLEEFEDAYEADVEFELDEDPDLSDDKDEEE